MPRAGWATEAHGPLECYRDFRQKYARATSQPFRRAAGVFATSTRATGARLKLCQAQAVGRFPAESYSLPIPSFPLQPLRPHNARTRARCSSSWDQCGRKLEAPKFSVHPYSGCQKQWCNFLPPFATLVLPTRNIPSGTLWGPKYCTFGARKAARNRARRDRNDSKFTRRSPPDRPAEG